MSGSPLRRLARLPWTGARWLASMGPDADAYVTPWEASIRDDIRLSRPVLLLLRVLRLWSRMRRLLPGGGQRPGVTVVIVNWNGAHLLPEVISAVERFSPPTTEILVMDNASSDGSRRWLHDNRHRLRTVRLPVNIHHAPAMDIGFTLARTERVVALDVDAFPIADTWMDVLGDQLDKGSHVAGAEALRGYAHPCCLMMDFDRFVTMRHTFLAHVGDWNPDALGTTEWDTGEMISRREGADHTYLLPRTSYRGPLRLGSVFGEVVYHCGASLRLTTDDPIEGLALTDAQDAWSEAVEQYLS